MVDAPGGIERVVRLESKIGHVFQVHGFGHLAADERPGAGEGVEEGGNGKVYKGGKDAEALEADLEALGKDTHEVRKTRKAGGSLTALPVIETLEGEVSAYSPTNVISSTDGQIYLEPGLFFAGVRPAINVGLSVSRVGGAAQEKAMKQVAGTLRLDLAQYRELESFAAFGSDLDAATQKQLTRGARLVEVLKQPQYQPLSLEKQVTILYAGAKGFLDDLPISAMAKYEAGVYPFMESRHPEIFAGLDEKRAITDEIDQMLNKALTEYGNEFKDTIQ